MHVNDFAEDRPPTLAQWRRLATELLALSGERAPTTRLAATELLLRVDTTEPAAAPAAASNGAAPAADDRARRAGAR